MVIGDFNLHINKNSNEVSEFKNSLDAFGFVHYSNFHTYVNGHILDLVITGFENGIDILSCNPFTLLSDHCAVKVLIFKSEEKNIVSTYLLCRNFKDMNEVEFEKDLAEI